MIDIVSSIDAVMEAGLNSTITPTILEITGKPPKSLDDFITDHRTAFERPAAMATSESALPA
jgi:hypothetical protein